MARAQSPAGTPGETPPQGLLAPSEVRYDQLAHAVRWIDNATNETGYRILVTISNETRSFEVGANVEELFLPDDFRLRCPPGGTLQIEVRAFNETGESEPDFSALSVECAPPTPTSTAPFATSVPTPPHTTPLVLPSSGTAAAGGGNAYGLVVLLATGGVLALAAAVLVRRLGART